ncbi:MAG: Fis family transcriptional regulator, partial [Candidatus Sabulitectum sp.]|nr:Fis family transcriptional regulator [Candidatus Sabulitectum sp.]
DVLFEKHCLAQGIDVKEYDPQILPLLLGYSWPGNIRELENFVERAIVLSAGHGISVGDLPLEILPVRRKEASASSTMRGARADTEKQMILAALKNSRFNRTSAALELGIHKTTLYRRIKALGISLPEVDGRS